MTATNAFVTAPIARYLQVPHLIATVPAWEGSGFTGKARGRDVVIADTAGRLPTQLHLMEELKKIKRVVQKADDLTLMTSNGVAIRIKNKDVKQAGRATKGVHLIKPQDGDSVASVARIAAEDLKKAGAQLADDDKVEPQPQLI